ncbi:MAG: 3-oxoacyl-[acyl-carrier protein] reductase [uncultured Gemmatimonadaceae bacterium]|uniref:3-oxoacyl-[acyl-carrier protein] reductase n=1 Tax=uncultured Gemmatimonadaceae bacterium TaxID=246130 RepID=A0A6J4KDM6_9BACT|nr:MAG: 3-oxoacyl-[acyl-carrier protein] reductase [uncultured Gemmatimonadaceae bacterium]
MSTSPPPVYLVLGAAGGIGSALARRLAAGGARLVLAGRTAAPLDALAAELGATTVVGDATRFDDVDRAVATTVERHGRLDGAANCVGSLLLKPAHLTRAEEFAETVAQNLTSAFAVVRSAARAMLETGGGSVVLVSSAAARVGLANHEAIAAAKAGVIGLAASAAATYAAKHVRVNAVAPGLVRTGLTRRITGSAAGEQSSLAMHALGRLGEPDDVASLIAWLLAPEQRWVTGQVYGVDGGLATVRAR